MKRFFSCNISSGYTKGMRKHLFTLLLSLFFIYVLNTYTGSTYTYTPSTLAVHQGCRFLVIARILRYYKCIS